MNHPFRAAMQAHDIDAAVELLTQDVVFSSPVAFHSYRGRAEVRPILEAVVHVLDDFEYVDELRSGDGASRALTFRARVGGLALEGCDFIHHEPDGRIDRLTVMVRPLSAASALAESMSAVLATSSGSGG